MKVTRFKLFYSLFVFGILFLASCSSLNQGDLPVNQNILEPTQIAETELLEEKEKISNEPVVSGSDQSHMETNMVPTQTSDSSVKFDEEFTESQEMKTEIVATNPDTVNLMSGDLHFIEFFAYW